MKKRMMRPLALLLALCITLPSLMATTYAIAPVTSNHSIEANVIKASSSVINLNETSLSTCNLSVSSQQNGTTEITVPTEQNNTILLTGKFYPFTEGLYKDNLLVGDFISNMPDITVCSVRIDNNVTSYKTPLIDKNNVGSCVITIIMMDSESQKLTIQGVLTDTIYESLYTIANKNKSNFLSSSKNTSRVDYLDMITQLDIGHYTEDLNSSGHIESKGTNSTTSNITNYTDVELSAFINAVRNSGYAGVDPEDYGISPAFLMNTGTQYTDAQKTSTISYIAGKYTSMDPNQIYYSRLTVAGVTKSKTSTYAAITMEIANSIMVEYVPGGVARMYLDDYGVRIKNIKLAVGDFRKGSTYGLITSSEMTGNVTNLNINVPALLGLTTNKYVAILGTALDLCSYQYTHKFNQGPADYGDTESDQLANPVTNYKVVRAVTPSTGSAFILDAGQRMRVVAYTDLTSFTSYQAEFDYTCSIT